MNKIGYKKETSKRELKENSNTITPAKPSKRRTSGRKNDKKK